MLKAGSGGRIEQGVHYWHIGVCAYLVLCMLEHVFTEMSLHTHMFVDLEREQ